MRSEFEYSHSTEDGALTIQPAISTFSDHIVASFPLQRITFGDVHEATSLTLAHLNSIVSTVARQALSLGFLVRGAVAVGELYHAEGVVFGEAMVEAYRLEVGSAIYPRIILSDKVIARLGNRSNHFVRRDDDDGLHYLDYFEQMLIEVAGTSESELHSLAAWFLDAATTMRNTIHLLEDEGKRKERKKWAWFAKSFLSAIKGGDPIIEKLRLPLSEMSWTDDV